jgi:hypothetical protein
MASNGLLEMILKIPVLNILILLLAVLSVEIVGDRWIRFLVSHAGTGDHKKKRSWLPFHLGEATRDG